MTSAVRSKNTAPLWMSGWAKGLGVTLLLLNVADLIITFVVLGRGGVEMNPLSAWLIERQLIIPLKIGICLWIAFSVFFLKGSVNRLQFKALTVVVVLYSGVVLWNLTMLFLRH